MAVHRVIAQTPEQMYPLLLSENLTAIRSTKCLRFTAGREDQAALKLPYRHLMDPQRIWCVPVSDLTPFLRSQPD